MRHTSLTEGEQRRESEDRKAAAERQREAEAAAAIRARLRRVVDLTPARLGAVADPKATAAKMVRLSEIQESLAANKDPIAPAIIVSRFQRLRHALRA